MHWKHLIADPEICENKKLTHYHSLLHSGDSLKEWWKGLYFLVMEGNGALYWGIGGDRGMIRG